VLRQGVISPFIHGIAGYAIGAFLIVAPFLFGFEASAAVAVSIVAGVFALVLEASSDLPTGLARVIPAGIHFVVDLLIGAALIASPFLFAFWEESAPTATFIAVGIAGLLLTIGTKFVSTDDRA
jgi:VIT1/CCC1 family predicted Fe2+/Mn2+ transporter